jgi:hypothetical protein
MVKQPSRRKSKYVEKTVTIQTKEGPKTFKTMKRETKEKAKCKDYEIGQTIKRETATGSTVTLERVAPRGKKGNLCWKLKGSEKKKKTP